MEKIFAVLLILGAFFFFAPNHVDAGEWHDFIHLDSDYEWEDCWKCNGSGECYVCDGTGICLECYGNDINCSWCLGYGRCSECDGDGRCDICHGMGGEWL